MDFQSLGRLLFLGGLAIAALGGLLWILGRVFPALGQLPGDVRVQSGNFSCFAPFASMVILSIILTIVLNIVIRLLD